MFELTMTPTRRGEKPTIGLKHLNNFTNLHCEESLRVPSGPFFASLRAEFIPLSYSQYLPSASLPYFLVVRPLTKFVAAVIAVLRCSCSVWPELARGLKE